MPNDKELTPEELVEKVAIALAKPCWEWDQCCAQNKRSYRKDAARAIAVAIKDIERGEIVESFVDYDGQITTELKPPFKKWLEERKA